MSAVTAPLLLGWVCGSDPPARREGEELLRVCVLVSPPCSPPGPPDPPGPPPQSLPHNRFLVRFRHRIISLPQSIISTLMTSFSFINTWGGIQPVAHCRGAVPKALWVGYVVLFSIRDIRGLECITSTIMHHSTYHSSRVYPQACILAIFVQEITIHPILISLLPVDRILPS